MTEEQLLVMIRHLRREVATKDNRIADLEAYLGKLLFKVLNSHPELLERTS